MTTGPSGSWWRPAQQPVRKHPGGRPTAIPKHSPGAVRSSNVPRGSRKAATPRGQERQAGEK